MAIDYDNILGTLVQIAAEVQYTVPLSQTNGLPSVLRMRSNNPKLDFPFITVDVLDTTQESAWLLNTFVNDDDNLVYETNYHLLIQFRVHADAGNPNAQVILNQLEGYFRLDRVRDRLTRDTTGALLEKFPIENAPILLDDKYIESASFNIIFGITDTVIDVDTEGAPITTIDLDGELKIHEDDPQPLEADVFVTKP